MDSPGLRWVKSQASTNPIPGGCVLYLPLWNPACWGATFKSIDPFGHVCTRTGGVMDGDGFTADGNDLITVPDHASLNMGTGDFALLSWFKTATTIRPIFSKGQEGGGGKRYYFGPQTDAGDANKEKLFFGIDDDTTYSNGYATTVVMPNSAVQTRLCRGG